MELRFDVLGPVRAWRGDQELDLGPARQRAVLAVLLTAANQPVPVDRIVDAVWPDAPPENGPNVVQKYVAGLRRVLDPDRAPRAPGTVLHRSDAGYRLQVGAGALDADRVAALVRQARAAADPVQAQRLLADALARWWSPAYAGIDGAVVAAERARLAEARAAAWEQWAELALGNGHPELLPELARQVAEHPARERLRGLQVRALHRAGRQAEALAAYQDARRYLLDEYGVEPGDELRRIHHEVLSTPPPAPGPVPRPAPPPGPAPVVVHVRRGWRRPGVAAALGALPALASFGVLSWLVIAVFAGIRRSRALAAAAAGYLVLVTVALLLIEDNASVRTGLGSMALLVAAFGGAAHGAVLAVQGNADHRAVTRPTDIR